MGEQIRSGTPRWWPRNRRLRLTGYEVYRCGGAEFSDPHRAATMLDFFFDELLSGETRPHLSAADSVTS